MGAVNHIPTLGSLRELQAAHLISVRPLDDLIICNYTEKCTFAAAWDDDTTICRGLILRVDKPWPDSTRITEIVALPFRKFFNVGERGLEPSGQLVSVTEKMDGSLGILYRHEGQYRVATRGSFDSEQAQWATEYIQRFDFTMLHEHETLLFEIIYPENRVVVDYGNRAELVLLGIIDRFTGQDYSWPVVESTAQFFGFPIPQVHSDISSIQTALERARNADHSIEGWVLRMDDGTRWKVKTDGYRLVHKLLNGISRNRVLEMLLNNVLDGWLEAVPEEFQQEICSWRDEAISEVDWTTERICNLVSEAPKATRKEFALWAKEHHRQDMSLLFAALDGRDLRTMILKGLMEGP